MRYLLAIITVAGLWLAMGASDAATTNVTPVVVDPTVGFDTWMRAGDRLAMPTTTGGFTAVLDPGTQTGNAVFSYPVVVGSDTLAVLGLPQHFTAKITFNASTTSAGSINVPAGTAPSVPADGDIWETTAGLFLRVNGTTIGPVGAGGGAGVITVNTRNGVVVLTGTDIPSFVASGSSHAPGAVPDPGASAGTTKFLREDATWAIPAAVSGVSSVNTRTGAVTLVGTDIPAFIASGASHAPGAVPDPGVTAGSTRFLREDSTFAVPSGALPAGLSAPSPVFAPDTLLTVNSNTTAAAPEARAFYPQSVYLVPYAQRFQLQSALDTYGAVRLENANYFDGQPPGYTIILRSFNRIYGTGAVACRLPQLLITAGSTGIVLSGIGAIQDPNDPSTANITFQAGAPITNCVFRHIDYVFGWQGTGSSIDGCTWFDCSQCAWKFDNTTSGYFRNSRILATVGGSSNGNEISLLGNSTTPNFGNQIGAHNSRQQSTTVSAMQFSNTQNFSMWMNGFESSAGSTQYGIDLQSSVTSARVLSLGGTQTGGTMIHASTPNFFLMYNAISGGLPLINYATTGTLSADFRHTTQSLDIDNAVSPTRFHAFPNNGYTTVNGVTTISGALSGGDAANFAALAYPARSDTLWAAPTWDLPPAAPLGSDWAGQIALLPDASAYIQNLIDTNGIAVLGPGVFKIGTPLKIGNTHGVIGAGMHKTVLLAATTSTDIITQNNAIVGDAQQIVVSDLTLQGGANGIHHQSGPAGLRFQFTNMAISHVCFRDMTNAGMFLDQIYAWDTNGVDNCDFVNCAYGMRALSLTGHANDNTAYVDNMRVYHARFENCGYGVYFTNPDRPDGGDSWINCQFANCTNAATWGDNCNEMSFVNCVMRNNAGNPSMNVTSGDLFLIGDTFDAGSVSGGSLVSGKRLFVVDSTFSKGNSTGGTQAFLSTPDPFGNGEEFLWNDNLVDIPAGATAFQHLQSVNTRFGGGDYASLSVGWAFQANVGASIIQAIATAAAPVPQMLRGAALPTLVERLQSIDGQGVNTPFSPQDLAAASGGGPFIATGSTTSRTPADRGADRWNVKDFGCIDDGTTAGGGTDNSAALTAAVAAAHTQFLATGQPVGLWLGKGTYALGSTVVWQSGVSLQGPGCLVTRGASTYTGAMHALIDATGVNTVTFSDLTGYGVGPDRKIAGPCTDTSGLGHGDSFLDFDLSDQINIINCQLFRFQDAIILSQSNDMKVRGNYINCLSSKTLAQMDNGTFVPYTFAGDPGCGIRFLGERLGVNQTESDNVICADNLIICVGLDVAIDLTSQSGYPFHSTCHGNYVAGCNAGIQVYTSGAATPDPGTLTTTDRACQIVGNYCQWIYEEGIYIRGVEGISCVGNHVDRCALLGTLSGSSAGGILERIPTTHTFPLSPVSHDLYNIISGNLVTDCGNPLTGILDAGIRCDNPYGLVSDNVVVRSFDRFGANLTVTGSFGICTVDVGGVAGVSDAVHNLNIVNNQVRGFGVGLIMSYVTEKTTVNGGFSCAIQDCHFDTVQTGITLTTLSSGYLIDHCTVQHASVLGIGIKNSPYSKITRCTVEGVPIGIQLSDGCQASDYYSVGGRMGPTLVCSGNTINGATTPININNVTTGDASVRSRCLVCQDNTVNGVPFNRDATGSFTFTSAPTSADFRIWHIGDVAPVRTPTSAGPGWTCTTAGAFGATIATTATTTNLSTTVTFSATTCVVPDDYIAIAGVTGTKHVLSINPATNTCVVDVACDASVSGAAITRPAPLFNNLIPVTQGGLNLSSTPTNGQIPIGNGTGYTLATLTAGSGTTITNGVGTITIASTGGGTVPTGTGFTHITGGTQDSAARAVNVSTTDITGIQAVGNGGMGAASQTAHGVLLGQGTSAITATTVGTTGQVLTGVTGADPVWTTPGASGVSSVNTRIGAVTLVGTDIPSFVASGASHAPGAVPDPGATPGTTRFLREDGSFQVPSSAGGGFPASTTTYLVQDTTDNTKQQLWNLASSTTGTNLTLKGQQTTSQTIAFPNVTAADTMATLGVANVFAPPALTAVAPPAGFTFTGGAHTALTSGSAGSPEVLFDGSQTKQWGGNGAVATYSFASFKPPVLSSTTAGTVFTNPATVTITGQPTAGTNASVSGSRALTVTGNAEVDGTLTVKVGIAQLSMTQAGTGSGLVPQVSITGGTMTNLTAGGNFTQFLLDYSQNQQHATGAVALNQTVLMKGPALSAAAASTITEADALSVVAPTASTNATITNANALRLTGQMLLDPQAAGSAPQDGNVWADSTQQTLSTRSKGLTTPLVGSIFTATATGTCAATVTETSIIGTGIGTKTLSANYLVPGKTIRILIKGIVSNLASDTLDIKIKAGSTVILDTTAVAVVGTLTNAYFQVTATITCRSTGVSGTVMASGNLGYMNGATGQGVSMVNTSATSLDTTTSEALDVTATWGSNSASNSISGQVVSLDAVN